MGRKGTPLEELVRLYEEEGLSLAGVAARVGLTRQGVYYLLVKAGVRMRPKVQRKLNPPRFERELLVDLYENQRLTVAQIADRLSVGPWIINSELKKHGIRRRRPAEFLRKYPELLTLKIGESMLVPRTGRRPYPDFYSMAKTAGIRISIRSAGEAGFELTRMG